MYTHLQKYLYVTTCRPLHNHLNHNLMFDNNADLSDPHLNNKSTISFILAKSHLFDTSDFLNSLQTHTSCCLLHTLQFQFPACNSAIPPELDLSKRYGTLQNLWHYYSYPPPFLSGLEMLVLFWSEIQPSE